MKKRNSICLIDDDSTANLITTIFIDDLNITDQVLVFEDAHQALYDIEQLVLVNDCPSLIFLDVNMPLFNSFDFLNFFERIKNIDRSKVILIILSVRYRDSDFEKLKKFKIDEILEKPLTREVLKRLGKKYFYLANNRGELA